MRRMIQAAAVALMGLVAIPLFAVESRNVVDDVIRMTRAGVSEEAIVDFVHKNNDRIEVNADDMIAMADAKVSRFVMKAILDDADVSDGRSNRQIVERDTVVVAPRYGGYGYTYDPYYYDPFWYGPRLSLGFGFGSFYRGGYYRGGGYYGGGYHGGGTWHGGHSGGHHGHH